MRVITWNINGYRSAEKENRMEGLVTTTNPDIICLQEIKMNHGVINTYGYNCYYNFASKKGYSGTLCTDFNIVHTELDVKNYKTNYNNNMFSYDERASIDKLLELGFVDSFRSLNKEGNIYSMWPNGFNARERNMGWRIDYIFISKELEQNIKEVKYLKDQLGSDHCPCLLNIEFE